MPSVTTTRHRIVTRQRIRCYVDGEYRADIEPISFEFRGDIRPSSATFLLPSYLAGDDVVRQFRGREIVVKVNGLSNPVYRGFLDYDDNSESSNSSRITFNTQSALALLNRVHAGQETYNAEPIFLMRNPVTGDDYGWRFDNILEWIYGSQSLPSDFRSLIEVGDTSALRRTRAQILTPELSFPSSASDVLGATRRLFGFARDCGLRERFTNTKTVLDVFKYNDIAGGTYIFRAANDTDEGPEDGAVVVEYAGKVSTRAAYSRVIAYGQPRRYQITLSTNHSTMPLLPAWDEATTYSEVDPGDLQDATLTTTEAAVLVDPTSCIPTSPTFKPEREWVFRRFRIWGAFLAGWRIESQNIVRQASETASGETVYAKGDRLPIQIFRQKTILVDGENPGEKVGSIDTDDYELVSGGTITEDGIIELSKPLIAEWSTGQTVTSAGKKTYTRCHLYLTCTVYAPKGPRPGYDTGVKGYVNYSGISSGLTLAVQNDNCEVWILSAPGEGLPDWFQSYHQFGCIYYDEEQRAFFETPAGTPVTLKDDRPWLADMAERALAEIKQPPTLAIMRLPGAWFHYRVGEGCRLYNRGINDKRLTIRRVSIDYRNMETVIEASDEVMPTVQLNAKPSVDNYRASAAASVPKTNYDEWKYPGGTQGLSLSGPSVPDGVGRDPGLGTDIGGASPFGYSKDGEYPGSADNYAPYRAAPRKRGDLERPGQPDRKKELEDFERMKRTPPGTAKANPPAAGPDWWLFG